MKTFRCIVKNPVGIHARPAALIAQFCVGIKSAVKITCNGKTASGSDVLQILALNARKDDILDVEVDGISEAEDAEKLKELICNDAKE